MGSPVIFSKPLRPVIGTQRSLSLCGEGIGELEQEARSNLANPDTSTIMKAVAHSLTRSQIEAVAAYVNYLK
jgi:hypothetical protein